MILLSLYPALVDLWIYWPIVVVQHLRNAEQQLFPCRIVVQYATVEQQEIDVVVAVIAKHGWEKIFTQLIDHGIRYFVVINLKQGTSTSSLEQSCQSSLILGSNGFQDGLDCFLRWGLVSF